MELVQLNSKEVISGIYYILCTGSNKEYIGSSKNVVFRCNHHLNNLIKNLYAIDSKLRDHKPYLQSSFHKYGRDSIQFYILEKCDLSSLKKRETFFLQSRKPAFNASLDAHRGPSHWELTPEQQQQKYAKFIETKTKNNTFKPSPETIQRSIETKRRNGFFDTYVPERHQKMVETKRRNGTLNVPCLKSRGVKRPKHSEFMKNYAAKRYAEMSSEDLMRFSQPGASNGNAKPKITSRNTATQEIKQLYAFEWTQQLGVTAAQLSRVRHGAQNFIIDKNKDKWLKTEDPQDK